MRRQKFLTQYLNGNSSFQLEPNINFQYLSAKPAMKTQLSLLRMISALTPQVNISHRRTQDFTMEGVHMVGAGSGAWGTEVPTQWGPGVKPW